uniref:Zinc finger piccolo-type domain-containing protein n=1 Tax=Cyprinus carpio TaxID=7962 RepID=A0A8C1QCB0_CYPCA
MQRALGMDMTTSRSKSQQQIHSPSHQPMAGSQSGSKDTQRQRGEVLGPKSPERVAQTGRIPHPGAVPLPGLAKAQSQSDLGHSTPVRFGGQPDKARSLGNSPAHHQPSHEAPQDGLTQLFGFGASLLNQASTLISVDPLPGSSPHHSPARNQSPQGTKVIFSDANDGASAKTTAGPPDTVKTGPGPGAPLHKQPLQQQSPVHHQKQQSPKHHQTIPQQLPPLKQPPPQPVSQKPDVTCPLCKTVFNVGTTEPPNYKSCTQCHTEVCNLCGFNPTPHVLEVRSCTDLTHILYCVTKRGPDISVVSYAWLLFSNFKAVSKLQLYELLLIMHVSCSRVMM